MRAAIFDEHGGPEVLRVEEVETPEPGPGEVRLKVEAASLNHLDLWVRRGLPFDIPMPHIGGSDVAGVVDTVGPGAESVAPGTRVVVDPSLDYDWYDGATRGPSLPARELRILGEHTQGGFAEYAVAPAANLVEVPEEVDLRTAAAAGLVGVTAWHALLDRARLRAGERVLVTGASGGVSTMAVQIARLAGAEVFAVTSGEENTRRVRELGADRVYDRIADPEWPTALWKDTGKRGVDVVIDSVGQALFGSLVRSLAVGGRLVTYGATTGPAAEADLRLVFWRQLSVLGSTMGPPAAYRRMMSEVFAGRLRPVVHEVLALDEIRRAHELLEDGEVFGKIVIRP